MSVLDERTNADLIREVFKEVGENHRNRFLREYLRDKYCRDISISQIAAVLGRYEDRGPLCSDSIHNMARKFLVACRGDVGLAKKVLAHYE